MRPITSPLLALTFKFLVALALFHAATAASAQTGPIDEVGSPLRLRQPAPAAQAPAQDLTKQQARPPRAQREDRDQDQTPGPREDKPDLLLGEFERFVQNAAQSEKPIRRLGSDLMTPGEQANNESELLPLVSDDYLISIGDEILLSFWGSVDADLRLIVDRAGRIVIPRVGTLGVAGVRFADLNALVERQAARVFRNFQVSASLGKLRGIRVIVTGFVKRPGVQSLDSMSTILSALIKAGGPSAAGSFRMIELRRGASLLAKFDLYDLILKGDRAADRMLQSGDVVHVLPVGPQVGVIGSVNNPAVVELRPGETVADALRMAGGLSAVGDRSRVALEALQARSGTGVQLLQLPAGESTRLQHGDIVRAFSMVAVTVPMQGQNKRVRIEGEVLRPGDYVLPAGAKMSDALQIAGGLTSRAYVFGTDFSRESVRRTQLENYDRALRDLETELTRSSSTQRVFNAEQAAAQTASSGAAGRLIERLRTVRPTGRVVLQLDPGATELPELALEDGDRLFVPPRPTTVGVFGSVFNSGSYFLDAGSRIQDMLKLAGGPTRGADTNSLFVVRMNGSVASARQSSGWFGMGGGINELAALPGDTIFVPEELNKTSFIQEAKEWTQILYQFGLGAAALKTIRN